MFCGFFSCCRGENLFIAKKLLKKFVKNSSLSKGAIFAMFSAFNSGLDFILIFILSVVLTKNDFGILNLFNTLIIILSILIGLSTQSFFSVAYFKKDKKKLGEVVSVIMYTAVITYFFILLLLFILSKQISIVVGFSFKCQFFALTICLLKIFYTLHLEVYRLKEEVSKYGLLTTIWVIMNFALTLLFCFLCSRGWEGRVEAQMISAVIFSVFNIFFLFKKRLLDFKYPSKACLKEVLHYSIPLIPHNSTVWIRQGMDRYFISYFYSAAVVGSFSFAYNFAGMILMLGTAFNASNSVFIFKKLRQDQKGVRVLLRKQMQIMTVFFFVVTILCIAVSYVVTLQILPKYKDASIFILPFCLMAFCQCLYYLFVNFLFYFEKTKMLMNITFFVSLTHLATSFLVTRYSPLYTAYISLFSGALTVLFVVIKVEKIYPILKKNE